MVRTNRKATPKKFLKESKKPVSKKELLSKIESEAKRTKKIKKVVSSPQIRFKTKKCTQCKEKFESEFDTTTICAECEWKNSQA